MNQWMPCSTPDSAFPTNPSWRGLSSSNTCLQVLVVCDSMKQILASKHRLGWKVQDVIKSIPSASLTGSYPSNREFAPLWAVLTEWLKILESSSIFLLHKHSQSSFSMTGAVAGSEHTRLLSFNKLTVWWGPLTRCTACNNTASEAGNWGNIYRGSESWIETQKMNKNNNYSSVCWMFTVFVTVNRHRGKIPTQVCLSVESLTTSPEHLLWHKQNKSLVSDKVGKGMPVF